MTKQEIDSIVANNIYTNNQGLITGIVLQQVLLAMNDFASSDKRKMLTSTDTESELTDENFMSSLRVIAEILKNNDILADELKDLFLSKVSTDQAAGLITFLAGLVSKKAAILSKGWQTEEFVPGLLGTGSYYDGLGYGEMRRLRLWESLEAPEIRYNRVSVYTGIRLDTFGAGIIESVEIDKDSEGNELNTGIINLKLEGGEFGAIDEDDFCQGIFHDFGGSNDTEKEDQRNGNFRFKGFNTSYFRITQILDTGTNGRFRYILREPSERWSQQNHPRAQMHFGCYANPYNKNRQACILTTTEYSIGLKNMTSWEYGESNIHSIHGKLDGFSMGGTVFEGHGTVIENGYFSGRIQQFSKMVQEEVKVGGRNLLREYDLRFGFKYWGGTGEYIDTDIDKQLMFLSAESNSLIISENGLLIDLS